MKHLEERSRRSFLNAGARAAAALGLSEVLAPVSFAASRDRAVVCMYLVGGNDSNNMIVPLDSPAYDAYARNRGALAIAKEQLLPVQGTPTASYGFHPSLPGLRDLYNQNVVAVVANVGRVASDHRIAGDASDHLREMQLRYFPDAHLMIPWALSGSLVSTASVLPLAHSVALAAPGVHPLLHSSLAQEIAAAPVQDNLPDTSVGRQLSTVLSALKQGAFHQPAFLVPVSGFETTHDQLARQAAIFTEMDEALVAFYRAVAGLGKAQNVTVYTDTEFNRTLMPNKFGGTDHAWGGHQLVLGGSTLGGKIYGRFPSLEVGGADDAAGNGTWTPSISNTQYAGTLAYWYGKADLANVPEYSASANAMGSPLGFLVN